MDGRLRTDVRVSALMRRVNDSGGLAVILAKGDAVSGEVLALLSERNGRTRLVERRIGMSGESELAPAGPADSDDETATAYWRRRRDQDPDLWVVALDTPDSERFVAETIL